VRTRILTVSGPVEGAKGELLPEDAAHAEAFGSCGRIHLSATAGGRLDLAGLPPGGYRLRIDAPGLVPELVRLKVVDGVSEILPVTLVPGAVFVARIVDEQDRPVPGARLTVGWFGAGGRIDQTFVASKDGRAGVRVPERAVVEVAASATGHAERRLIFQAGSFPERIVLNRLGLVRGILVDPAAEKRVEGARAQIRLSEADSPPDPSLSGPTSADLILDAGELRWEGLAGLYDVSLRAPGYFRRTLREVAVRPGDTTDLGDVELDRGGTLRGRVVDAATGLSVGDAVLVECRGRCRETAEPLSRTDSEGHFLIEGLPGGPVRILVMRPGYVDSLLEISSEVRSRPERIEVSLTRGGGLEGRVADLKGEPQARARVIVEDRWRARTAVTDPAGWYRLDDIAPGQRAVTKYVPGGGPSDVQRRSVGIREGETVRLDLGVGARAVGTVRRAGERIAGASVMAYRGEPPGTAGGSDLRICSGRTDEDGWFEIAGLEAGPHWLVVEVERVRSRVRFDLPPEDETVRVDVDLPPAGLRGIVLDDETGAPLDGVQVTMVGSPGPEGGEVEGRSFGVSLGSAGEALVGEFRGGFSLATGPDGRFEAPMPAGGHGTLAFMRGGYVSETRTVLEGTDTDLEVRLRRASALRVRVQDVRGEFPPHGWVHLVIRSANGREIAMKQALSGTGVVRLGAGLDPSNEHLVGVSVSGLAPAPYVRVELEPGQDNVRTFILDEGGTLEILLSSSERASPLEDGPARDHQATGPACLRWLDRTGRDLIGLIPQDHFEVDPGEPGRLRVRNAPTGTFTLECGPVSRRIVVERGVEGHVNLAGP
jgi:hypothetical protein